MEAPLTPEQPETGFRRDGFLSRACKAILRRRVVAKASLAGRGDPTKEPLHEYGRHAPEPSPLVNLFVKSAQLLSSHVKQCQEMSSDVKESLDSVFCDINDLASNELTNAASAMS